jgi:hypothetical protein
MAESAFNFNQAPSTGGARQFGKVAAAGKAIKSVFGGGKSSSGLSAADRAALITHQGQVDIGVHAVKNALAESSAASAHEREMKKGNATRRQETKMEKLKHENAKAETTHMVDHFERMGSSGQFSNLNVNSKGVSGTFNKPASGGVGGDTSIQTAASLD